MVTRTENTHITATASRRVVAYNEYMRKAMSRMNPNAL